MTNSFLLTSTQALYFSLLKFMARGAVRTGLTSMQWMMSWTVVYACNQRSQGRGSVNLIAGCICQLTGKDLPERYP